MKVGRLLGLFGVRARLVKRFGVMSRSHEVKPVRGCECWRCDQARRRISNGFVCFPTAYKQRA